MRPSDTFGIDMEIAFSFDDSNDVQMMSIMDKVKSWPLRSNFMEFADYDELIPEHLLRNSWNLKVTSSKPNFSTAKLLELYRSNKLSGLSLEKGSVYPEPNFYAASLSFPFGPMLSAKPGRQSVSGPHPAGPNALISIEICTPSLYEQLGRLDPVGLFSDVMGEIAEIVDIVCGYVKFDMRGPAGGYVNRCDWGYDQTLLRCAAPVVFGYNWMTFVHESASVLQEKLADDFDRPWHLATPVRGGQLYFATESPVLEIEPLNFLNYFYPYLYR
jgi:hypothetical protein